MGTGPAVLIIIGFILVFGGLMWSASVQSSWMSLNSTASNQIQNGATQAGLIYSAGAGYFIIILGIICFLGAFLLIITGVGGSIGGR